MITKEGILTNLNTVYFGKIVYTFESIDSTNIFAKSLSKKDGPHGTLIISEEQTSGRGRLQRKWVGAKGKNLTFTLVLYPEFSIEKISILPFAAALAVANAIESIIQLQCECKWPNDILINGKKVCGMLLESKGKKIVLGIGINVNQNEFSNDLLHKASSLKLEVGKEFDRIILLKRVLQELENRYEQLARFPSEIIINDWKKKSLLLGKKITVLEGEFSYTATAEDVANDGSLVIQTEDGMKKRIYAGDVSLVASLTSPKEGKIER